ncbi:MAG: 3'(2'),5'-bisphosphate nucleotidase [Anaerolineales bacterium]|nr:MAG: 3'(2'),5'-bisphosphate nucleotidase [Anaerolineales bacterium]
MFELYAEEARFALQAVRRAANLCRQIQAEMVSPAITKADQSPVTVADYASQSLVGQMLMQDFPRDRLVAEEDSQTLRQDANGATLARVTSYIQRMLPEADRQQVCAWIDHGGQEPEKRFWTYDTIDGTKGFLRGDQYVTALALIEDGQVVVAALGCPNLDRTMQPNVGGEGTSVVAVRGQGCYGFGMDGDARVRLHVSERDETHMARLLRSFESDHTHEGKMAQLVEALGTNTDPVLMDSQAKYAVLAAGGGDLLFRLLSPANPDYEEKIWDQAAGSLIVEEAGGQVTDLRGEGLDFRQGRTLRANVGVLASNGRLHAQALEALRTVGADRRPEKP